MIYLEPWVHEVGLIEDICQEMKCSILSVCHHDLFS